MIAGKTILILGGTGSLGQILARTYSQGNRVIIFSRDENKQWALRQLFPKAIFVLGDIRDLSCVRKTLVQYSPQIIILAAAQKHVDICEVELAECIKTNLIGTQNVVETVLDLQPSWLETVLFVSTDKACHPINAYGMCKALSERIVVEASRRNPRIKFVVVRYGNVLNSRGSLIPKFQQLGKEGKDFPLTSEKMTRFFMTLPESVELINTAITVGKSGQIWIPRIKSYSISELAHYFAKKYSTRVVSMPIRPGEKLHETLVGSSEVERTWCFEDRYLVICPIWDRLSQYGSYVEEFTSEKTSPIEGLISLIEANFGEPV